jgi:hypothetical protein
MNTKLTLSLDKNVIERAKLYAKEHEVSVSFLVENYLLKITSDYKEDKTTGSIVSELSGIVDLEGIDYQEEHANYLTNKYK